MRRASVEELESRILLSADLPGAGLADVASDPDELTEIVEPLIPQAPTAQVNAQQTARHELVFVDAAVDDWETLVDDLLGQSSTERIVEVVVLDASRDGVSQIADSLAGATAPIDAVHVVSHGTEEGLQLGGTWLDGARLESQAEIVAGWREALSEDADLLLYGCNLAASSEGKALIDHLAGLTGADVAASDDATGAAALGGDWDLEHQTGSLESFVLFSAKAQLGYGAILDGTAMWSETGNGTPQTRDFDGTTFGPETTTQPVGHWEVIAGAEAPTRDEKIVIGIDDAGTLSGQIWDGTSWTALPGVIAGLNPEEWAFDVAYSSQSGDALIAWADPTGGITFATWDGTSFSGPLSFGGPIAGQPTHLEMAADPNSDEIMVVGTVSGVGDFAAVWDGTSFVAGQTFPLGLTSPYVTDIDVAYEAQSGNAMVVYGDATNLAHYAVYDGATWTSGVIVPALATPGVPVRWTELASDPNSDRIAMIVGTSFQTAWVAVWDGSAWQPSVQASSNTHHSDRQNVAVAFESTSGEAIAAYTRFGSSNVYYQRWTPGGGWLGEEIGPALSTHPDSLTLAADPNSDAVMLSVVEDGGSVSFTPWDGNTWGTPRVLEADSGTNMGQPFLFLWDQEPFTLVDAELWLSTEGDVSGGGAPGTWDSGSLVELGGPGFALPTSGTFDAVFKLEAHTADGDANIDGIHYVSRDVLVGSVNPVQLLAGDVLLSATEDETIGGVFVEANDIVVFRPSQPGNYGGPGTFFLLVNGSGTPNIRDFSLVETATTVGGVLLDPGTFLYTYEGSQDIHHWVPIDPAAGAVGVGTVLVDVSDINVGGSNTIRGVELVQTPTSLGGILLKPGQLLVTLEEDDTIGDNVLGARKHDVVALSLASVGPSNTAGTASLVMDGNSFGLSSSAENVEPIALVPTGLAIAVNDAPLLTPSAPALTPITEDDVGNPGDLVSDILGSSVTELDAGDPQGLAVIGLGTGNGTWEYSLDGGSVWTAVPAAVSKTQALLLRDTDRIRFVPDTLNGEIATFDFRAWDQSTGAPGAVVDTTLNGGNTAFSTDTDTASITVADVNDAPVLTPGAPSLPSISEDDVNGGGRSVAQIVGASITDADASALQGIAITGQTPGNGTWEYSTDGGTSWSTLPAGVSDASALLLRDSDRVRFVPDGQNADAASFDFRAWDQTSGSAGSQADASNAGGTTAFSLAADTASITVTGVNDAPVLAPSSPSLPPITEDDLTNGGAQVSTLLVGASDVDTGDPRGIAITMLDPSNGRWEYSLDGGASWNAVPGGVTDNNALLLRDSDWIRLVPDGQNPEAASFDFRAWDQTTGTAGMLADTSSPGGATAFSAAKDVASILVTGVNDAPTLALVSPSLTPINEDDLNNPGDLVSSLIAGSVTDVDAGALEGIAIVSLTSSNGTWEYSTDAGASWSAVGFVSATNALLLQDTDHVRFVPDGLGPDAASFDFRAWDQTTGTAGTFANTAPPGGTTAFSPMADTADIVVGAVNDAPVLTPAAPFLSSITEDDLANGGDLVSSLISGSVIDPDGTVAVGIAVNSVTPSNGAWEYSLDGGASWTAIGPVSDASALLLRDSDLVRFVPDGQNADNASFGFRAWDQTTGTPGTLADASLTGGTSAFSLASDVATIAVSGVNDAPVLTPTTPSLASISEDDVGNGGELVSALRSGSVTDVDLGAVYGVALTGQTPGNGTWEYSLDGGASWSAVGPVSDGSALLLRDSDRVRFVPDGLGPDNASLDFRAWDQTTGAAGGLGDASQNGGTHAFSAASDTASITVTPANDAPVLVPSTPTLPTISEDALTNGGQQIAILLGSSVSDPDATTSLGVAVNSLGSGNGTWEYSLDGGASWSAIGAVSDTSALLLRGSDFVRFVPDGMNADAAFFGFRAWDESSGVAGTLADASAPGGSSPFSLAFDTASITVTAVNDAPVLDNTGNLALVDVAENDPNPGGDSVAAIIASGGGDRITDVDTGAIEGVAVTGVDDTNGTWQFSTDGGTIWTDFGSVSDASAVLLDAGAHVRFVPDAGYVGAAGNLTFRAWDQTAGANGQTGVDVSTNGGITPYSAQVETATLGVTPLNAAPVLTPSAPNLAGITEDQTGNAGADVSTLLVGSISDPNAGALQGIAVTGLASGNGTWQYSTDSGATWSAVGSVSDTSALLLRDVDKLRFVPNGLNATSAAVDYRAWDQTSGAAGARVDASIAGGSTAFSLASDTASIAVAGVNDAPSMAGAATLAPVLADDANPPGATVASLLGGFFSDVDAGAGFSGVAVIGNLADPATEGVWQYSSDGGAHWFAIGNVGDDASALALNAATRVRFLPQSSFGGVPASLVLRGMDDTHAGFSSTAGGSETRVNVDASVNGGASAISANASAVSTSIGTVVIEPDPDPDPGPDPEPEPEPDPEPVPEDPPEDPTPDPDPIEPPLASDPPGEGTSGAPAGLPTVLMPPTTIPEVVSQDETESRELDDDRPTETGETVRTGLSVLRDIYLGTSNIGGDALTSLIFQGQRSDFLGDLDVAQEDIQALLGVETRMVGSSIAVTTGLSVGYVLWLTRGGLLIASLLSSLPAWRVIDPIPVLAQLGLDDESEEEDESLDSLVSQGAEEPARDSDEDPEDRAPA